MESVCHLLLSDSEAGTPDVELDSVWQQTCNQVFLFCVIRHTSILYNLSFMIVIFI